MDPRTFLPARRVQVAQPPRPGEPARALAGVVWDAPTVVAFLRHVGCPFAEATFLELREAADANPEIRFAAVSHAEEAATSAWCDAVTGGPGPVQVVVDEGRVLYGSWGLGPGSLGHFLGRRSLAGALELSRRGVRNRHPVGTRWQTAGTFAIDAGGVVRFVHLPRHANNLPDLRRAVSAAGDGAGARST